MTDVIGGIVAPNALIVPRISGSAVLISGAAIGTLLMSGAKLYVATATGTFQLITSV